MYFKTRVIALGWLENAFCGWLNELLPGISMFSVVPAVVMLVFAGMTSLMYPGTNCGWLNILIACAWNSIDWRSVMFTRFTRLISQLLMRGKGRVLRGTVVSAPTPAATYCALALLARYATTCPAEFISGVTSEPVPGTPLGFRIARSPQGSPFPFAST